MTIFTSASDIALEISQRLSQITIANGSLTDIGTRVFRGRHAIDEKHVPCVVVFEADDDVLDAMGKHSGKVKLSQVYALVSYLDCDPDVPNDAAHMALKDMKKAIFRGDRTFGGKVIEVEYKGRAIGPRADGVKSVSARLDIQVVYAEDLCNP